MLFRSEGKGKVVDTLTKDYDIVARFQSGPNAEHTIEFDEKGTGLGLSIVKHIAVLFDAEIQVDSKLGEGSTFTISFR